MCCILGTPPHVKGLANHHQCTAGPDLGVVNQYKSLSTWEENDVVDSYLHQNKSVHLQGTLSVLALGDCFRMAVYLSAKMSFQNFSSVCLESVEVGGEE